MIAIDDPLLPGLNGLAQDQLRAITGASEVEVLRLRYSRGQRAVLHLSSAMEGSDTPSQGAIWFYPGNKARRLAARSGGTVFDPGTNALYSPFPHDPRLPEIDTFLSGYADFAGPLIGGAPDGAPQLVRYRPGLSCTFRCQRRDGASFYVKLQRDAAVTRLAASNALLADNLEGTRLHIARVHAVNHDLNAVSFTAVPGQNLQEALSQLAPDKAKRLLAVVCADLRNLWSAPITPARLYDRQALLENAERSAGLIEEVMPGLAVIARSVVSRLKATPVRLALRPIHGDMKLEHVIIGPAGITLIDTESLSLGPPDYDLAQFYGRLHVEAQLGRLADATVSEACRELRVRGADSFDWCRGIVALHLAKFHAQRPGPMSAGRARDILRRLGQTR